MYDLLGVSKRVRGLRETMGFTQEKAAEAIGINDKTYKSIERAYRVGNVETLCMIADYYDVSMDYILYGKKASIETLFIDFSDLTLDKKKLAIALCTNIIDVLKNTKLG